MLGILRVGWEHLKNVVGTFDNRVHVSYISLRLHSLLFNQTRKLYQESINNTVCYMSLRMNTLTESYDVQ